MYLVCFEHIFIKFHVGGVSLQFVDFRILVKSDSSNDNRYVCTATKNVLNKIGNEVRNTLRTLVLSTHLLLSTVALEIITQCYQRTLRYEDQSVNVKAIPLQAWTNL
jgi:thymidylate synthase ThyX